jgi:hypothetical protein
MSPSIDSKNEEYATDTKEMTVTAKALDDMYDEDGSIDPVYQAKARILNSAIQEIGMGKYQVYLFLCAGFGWFADSVWPVSES